MNGSMDSCPSEVRHSATQHAKRQTADTCRERASADVLKSASMLTVNERLTLERSAALWSLRAELLERTEETASRRVAAAAEEARS